MKLKRPPTLVALFALSGFAFAQEKKEPDPVPEKFELVSPGAIFPVNPGEAVLEPKLDKVTAKVVLAKFGGETATVTLSGVTAEIVDEPGSGPMQATFELKPKSDIRPMINIMTFLPKRHKADGWPRDKTTHFVIDEVLADSAPPNFAAAVMIECLLAGIEIPDNVVLFGAMDTAGKISRSADRTRSTAPYVEAVRLAAAAALPPAPEEEEDGDDKGRGRRSAFEPSATKVQKSMYLITGQMPVGTLDDFILDEDWDVLNRTQVLRCANFDEAIAYIRAIAEGSELGKSITGLGEAQKELRERSIRMLSNDTVWSRVVAAGRASKGNATAFAYARLRGRKVATTYSLDHCVAGIGAQVDRVVKQAAGLQKFDDRKMRSYMREVATTMGVLKRKIHPDAAALYAAAEDYLDKAVDQIKARRKAGREGELPQRVVEKYLAAKEAYTERRAEALAKLK